MKRKFVTRLLSGVTTAVVTVSSLAAPVMAAPEEEGFGDYLEEAFEEEAEEEYVETDDSDFVYEEETEDAELVKAAATSLATYRQTYYAIKGGNSITIDVIATGGGEHGLGEMGIPAVPIGITTDRFEVDYYDDYNDKTWFEHEISCNKAGTFKITYSIGGGLTAEATVVVYNPEDVIKIAQTDFTFKQGDPNLKTFTVTPGKNGGYHYDYPDGSDNTFSIDIDVAAGTNSVWYSEASGQLGNPVALVDCARSEGVVKFYIGEAGTTSGELIAYSGDYGYAKIPITITVLPADVLVSGVALNKTTLDMTVGGQQTLTATVSPADATNKKVNWSTSNAAVATVDENGKVTAMAKGSALITATTEDGNKTASCAVSVSDATVSVSGVSLDQTSLSLKPGDIEVLTATVSPTNASNTSVTFSSSNTSVATVNNIGIVTAKAAGTATITVKTADGNKTATCTVTVSNPTVAVTGVILDKTSVSLVEGDTATLQATVSPSNATNKAVTFTTSNDHVATVSAGGAIVAIAPGTATITATTADGSKTANCLVTVTAKTVSVTGVTLNKTSATLTEGETLALAATVAPANATNTAVTYTSSNADVASVDANGVVTAKAAGEATITVTTKDGSKTATCKITVNTATVAVTGVSLNKTTATLEAGESVTLTATVSPANASNKEVSFATDNADVATVDANGKVTAVGAGTATITVTTKNGSKTATCKVTVTEATVSVSGVSFDKSTMNLSVGDTAKITATVRPENATNKELRWTSSNPFVATIDTDGNVIAAGEGVTTITAKTADGSYTANCVVTVSAVSTVVDVTGVSLNQKDVTLKAGETTKLAAVVSPTDASYQSITWKSDDPAVANVDSTGLVSAVSAGSTYIRAYVVEASGRDYLYTAFCDVTVLAEEVNKAEEVSKKIEELPDPAEIKPEDKDRVEEALKALEGLTEEEKNAISAETLNRLTEIIAALEDAIKGGEETDGPTFKYNEETKAWDYYVDGKIDYDYYGFVDYEGYKFLVANGQIAAVNGLAMDPNSDLWYFCAEGQVVKHTGLVMYNEEWFYVKDGVLDTGLNALVPYNGGLFYVAAGRITREVSGLVLDPNGSGWYFVALGEVQNQYTGLATYNGAWFYVIKGRLAEDYTGVVTYDNQLFNVVNGMVY